MAPECRWLKLLLKSSKLNRHILNEVETILRFSFSPTSLYLENFKQIEGPGTGVQDCPGCGSDKSLGSAKNQVSGRPWLWLYRLVFAKLHLSVADNKYCNNHRHHCVSFPNLCSPEQSSTDKSFRTVPMVKHGTAMYWALACSRSRFWSSPATRESSTESRDSWLNVLWTAQPNPFWNIKHPYHTNRDVTLMSHGKLGKKVGNLMKKAFWSFSASWNQ